jgi:hypothetical protein
MKRVVLSLTLLLSVAAATANAAPIIFSPFPGPGNASVAGTGNSGQDGGRTNTYTFATPGAGYTDLWFGYFGITVPGVSGGVGSQQGVVAPLIVGNEATWAGLNQWQINMAVGPDQFYNVRFRMTTYDLANNPLNIVSAGSVPGLVGSAGAVLPLGLSNGFIVNFGFEVFNGATWKGVDSFFNTIGANENCIGDCVIRGATGGFWYEQAATVPEPASLALLGTGLAFSARRLRRRRSL